MVRRSYTAFAKQLELLPQICPNLRRLEFIPAKYVYDHVGLVSPERLGEVEELLLRPLLRVSIRMPGLRQFVVPLPKQLFFTLLLLDQKRPGPKQMLLGQEIRMIRMWYPFTVPTGVIEPGGGGFWIVYGDSDESARYDGT